MSVPDKIGRYKIQSEMGRGGMGTVYLAHDPEVDRNVALKVLPRQFLHDPSFRIRFQQEARLVARLEHEAIVPLYDFGEHEGQTFIVMRLLLGGSLSDRLAQGPLVPAEAAAITRRICTALDKAHAHNIIHRDLKPSNILFDTDGLAYLADFGIARVAEGTGTMTIIGTPRYMAPEQTHGLPVDARTDVYQMGVVLYEMLTGRVPFDATTPAALLHQHAYAAIPPLLEINPSLPPALDAVISRALAKDREQRYQSAGELSRAMLTAVASTIQASEIPADSMSVTFVEQRPTRMSPPSKAASPRRLGLWGGAIGGSILLLLLLFFGGRMLLAGGANGDDPTPNPTTSDEALLVNAEITDTPAPPPAATETIPPSPEPTETETPRPLPTFTRRPTPMPTATHPAQIVVAEDDFSSNTFDWVVEGYDDQYAAGLDEIADGRYRMTISSKQPVTHRTTNFSVKDFWFSVEATLIDTTAGDGNAEILLIFRETEAGDYYAAEFANDGSYAFYLFQNGGWITLQEPTFDNAVNLAPGIPNKFAVSGLGSQFTVYINNAPLLTLEDATLPGPGAIGLAVGLLESKKTLTVEFDNLVLRETE